MDKTPQELRPELIRAARMHAGFDGWSAAALRAAASDLGVGEEVARLAFPGGGIELLEAHLALADEEMMAELSKRNLPAMKIRERIATALRVRFEQAAPYREAVARGARLLALPQHAALAMRSVWATADAMWRAAGDTATDYNHYTKRVILSGVYSSALLYWLNDRSEGFADTWAFIDRRIEDVMQFEKTKARWRQTRDKLPSLSRFLGRLRYPAA